MHIPRLWRVAALCGLVAGLLASATARPTVPAEVGEGTASASAAGAADEAARTDAVAASAAAAPPRIRLIEFDGGINIINQRRITQAIREANDAADDLILIELNTPGGQVVALDEVIQAILNSEVPVVVWVGPAGARAASAGFFILIAADVAAMAPGTRTGAASTVYGQGENREGDVMLKKMNEDGAALLRSVARQRGRDVAAAEATVFEAKSYEHQVALELNLADLIADSRDDLLRQLDGRVVRRFDGSQVTLRTAGATFGQTEFDPKHVFMEILANPVVAGLLLSGAMLGLYMEFANPGGIFPGVLGALCLLLFFIAAQVLPISTTGVLLIVLAAAMFLLEIKVTSFGFLTLGGAIALGVGLWMLIDTPIPELRMSPLTIIPLSVAVAGSCFVALRFALAAQRAAVTTGARGLVGEVGRVTRDLDPTGKVSVHGEIWNATAVDGSLEAGSRVRVVAVEDLHVKVAVVEDGEEVPS